MRGDAIGGERRLCVGKYRRFTLSLDAVRKALFDESGRQQVNRRGDSAHIQRAVRNVHVALARVRTHLGRGGAKQAHF